MAGREGGNRFNQGDGSGEGRYGRGGGRFGRGGGRDRGGGGGGHNMLWMRDNNDGGSSNVDPRHGSSDKARWDAAAMEQGGARGSEKWGDNNNNTVASGAAGGRQDLHQGANQAQERRHPTPDKRNTSPLVGEKSQMRENEKRPTEVISYDKIVVNSMQIVPSPVISRKFSSYLDACVGEPIVTEMEHDDNSCEKKDQTYFVQSPVESSELVDVIPTPPVIEEMQARFSKRTAGINMEHVGARAEKMAKKRNLQGSKPLSGNSFHVLSNMEIISTASQMGVHIPDDSFVVIDVIRDLEKSRANIAKKISNNEKQQESMLLITNAAGESSPLNTSWGDEGYLDEEGFKIVKFRKKERRKVNVVISKPLTGSKNQKLSGVAGKTMDPRKAGN
ncbi:hypothetical protein D1007_23256 [Hordeum vulgare]|nr:hypothetical protein D1007_23256 [Hordeum vulgare]